MAIEDETQPPITLTASAAQDVLDALEKAQESELTVSLRTFVAASAGSYACMQHAARLEEQAFLDMVPVFDLSVEGVESATFIGTMKYTRWRVEITGGSASFQIDSIARSR